MMDAKIKVITYCTILILAFATCLLNVKALPLMPHRFYGAVTLAGTPASNGTLVEATINNITYASTTTMAGKYGYTPAFYVPADDPDTPEKEGGVSGDTIDFYVAKTYATNYTFYIGDITELNLTILAPTPYADFTADITNGTEPLKVKFTDQSKYFDNITSRTWNFGDTNTTTTTNANITHTYIQNGTYTVSLTVNGTNAGLNITDTETKTNYITVYDTKPKADFYAIPTSGTKPLTVSFYDNSTSYDGIVSWMWNFGDTNITTTTVGNITHTYNTTGIYTVKLTVTEPDGDKDTRIKEDYITVGAPPTLTILSPTTANPIDTQSGKTSQVTYNYTETSPKNVTIKIYNATHTIATTTITTNLIGGTNIQRTDNITIPATVAEGKYDLGITIFNTHNLSTTATQTNAVIIDNTPSTISNPYQDPPGQVVYPGVTIEVNVGQNVTVRVNVTDLTSGVKTVILSCNVTATQWANITMQKTGNEYTATIPSSQLPVCTTITYYITATDNAGNTAKTPTSGIYFQYHVIPEFTQTLAVLLIFLAFAATIAIRKKKEQRLSH